MVWRSFDIDSDTITIHLTCAQKLTGLVRLVYARNQTHKKLSYR